MSLSRPGEMNRPKTFGSTTDNKQTLMLMERIQSNHPLLHGPSWQLDH